jgi:hypothetical protein
MEYDLSGMTIDERINWHMERVKREEAIYEVHRQIRTGLSTQELKDELAELRGSIEFCQRVISVMEHPDFISGVSRIKKSATVLSTIQKNRAALLRRKFSGKNVEVEYKLVKIDYAEAIREAVSAVRIVEEMAEENSLLADRYTEVMFNFDGFEEQYECVDLKMSGSRSTT